MTMTTQTTGSRVEVTVRMAVERVIEQLREFSAHNDPGVRIGHAADSVAERDRAGRSRQRQAVDIADELSAASDADAVQILRHHVGDIANMGIGRAGVSTDWTHVALMAGGSGDARYVLDGGTLYQCHRPAGPAMTWDDEARTWRTGGSDWQWDTATLTWVAR